MRSILFWWRPVESPQIHCRCTHIRVLFLIQIKDLLLATNSPIHSFVEPITELIIHRQAISATLSRNLDVITDWGPMSYCRYGWLFERTRDFCTEPQASNLVTLYKAPMRQWLEYFFHVWGAAAPTTFGLLDSVQKSINHLIDHRNLTRK